MTKCGNCDAPLSPSLRYCPSCKSDAGAPNVRECGSADERDALKLRFEASRKEAISRGCDTEFSDFILLIEKNSCVIVNMLAALARDLATDPTKLYVNYETLVGSGVRIPALPANDRKRCGVAGFLFSSYATQINYGFLGFPDSGLPSYGGIACQMKPVSIKDRVSFLEDNSFIFFDQHKNVIAGGDIPKGYRSVWDNRHDLVMAKLGPKLQPGDTEATHKCLISVSGSMDRSQDEFVEAHVFEGFNIHAIGTMINVTPSTQSKETKIDAKIAIELFNKTQATP